MRLFRLQRSRGGNLLHHVPIALVKPSLKDGAYYKAGMPDYQNVEKKIAAILRVCVL